MPLGTGEMFSAVFLFLNVESVLYSLAVKTLGKQEDFFTSVVQHIMNDQNLFPVFITIQINNRIK